MAQQLINLGTPDRGNGDPVRTAFSKINGNFTDLYSIVDGFDLTNSIPSLSGNSGKFLSNNGTSLTWATPATSSSITANGHTVSINSNGIITVDGDPYTYSSTPVISVGEDPPLNPVSGNLWYETESGRTYVYYDTSWVDANPKGTTGTVLPNQNGNSGKVLTTDGSNLSWTTAGGNIDLTSVNSHIVPSDDATYDLGSPSKQWRSLYVSTNTIYINNVPISLDETNSLTIGGNAIQTTLEIDGGNASTDYTAELEVDGGGA